MTRAKTSIWQCKSAGAVFLLGMSGLGASWRCAAALVQGSLHPLHGGGCAWAGQNCSLQHGLSGPALLGFSSQWLPEPATREILDTDAFIMAQSCHPQLKLWIWETWCGVPDCHQLWMLRHTAGNGASIRVHHTLWLITAAHVSALEGVQTWDLVSWNVFCMFSKTGFWVSPTLSASEIHQNTYWELLLFNVFGECKCLVVTGWFLDWREIWSLRSASPVRM